MPENPTPEKWSRSRRIITLSLSLPTVVGAIGVLCAGFIAIFSLGILLGRGYDLEANIPELEKIMPQQGLKHPPRIIGESDEDGPDGQATPGEIKAPLEMEEADQVISQKDLAFPNSLRGSLKTPAARAPKEKTPEKPDQKTRKQDAKAEARADQGKQPERLAQQAKKQEQSRQAATDPVLAAAKPKESAAAGGRFRYSYQAAAYKEKAPSDAFTAKLKAAGVAARTQRSEENGVVWYRVMIDFTGRPDETDALREKMRSLGVPKVLLKTKTPVN